MLVYNSTLSGLDMICMLDKKVYILVTSTKNKSIKSFSRCKQYGEEIHRKREMYCERIDVKHNIQCE